MFMNITHYKTHIKYFSILNVLILKFKIKKLENILQQKKKLKSKNQKKKNEKQKTKTNKA